MKLARLLLALLAFLPIVSPAGATVRPAIWVASWYGPGFAGKPMANGKPLNPSDCSIAAKRGVPIGTQFVVWNLKRGVQSRWLKVTVQDRTAQEYAHRIDLSVCAARHLGYFYRGTTHLAVYTIHPKPAAR